MQKSHTVRSKLCKIFRKGKSMSTEIKSWLPGARNGWEWGGTMNGPKRLFPG